MSDHLNDPEIFELVKAYQELLAQKDLLRSCWKYYKNECRFSYGWYFTEKAIIAKPLDSKVSNDKKKEILTWRNKLIRQVTSYIDNNRNPAKVNVKDPTKENFTQLLSVKKIIDDLEISKDDYCRAFSIQKIWRLKTAFKKWT